MNLCNPSEIKALLARHNFNFSKSLGQNFLVSSHIPEKIADAAGLDCNTGVVEVGAGIGCLTEPLAKRAGRVVGVEIDRSLIPVLSETMGSAPNVKIIFNDILKTDLSALVATELQGLRPVVCANLPYNITTPAIVAFIEAKCFENITVMVQREVAKRICANTESADYGAFSVFANWNTEPRILFDVPPSCFMPQPKVWSSVIELRPRKTPPFECCNEKLFFRVVRSAFGQRRKTLVNALNSTLGSLTKEQLIAVSSSCGFSEKIRGESLTIADFVALANAIEKFESSF